MWFYISLLVLAILFIVWVSRTNLFRHWRANKTDPGQKGTGRGSAQTG
jgi:protein-S-isoprenylcysteine O-methyltransferase Ste14